MKTEHQRCVAYFKEIGHEAHEYRGSVYLYDGNTGFYVETDEVSFRASGWADKQTHTL